MNLIFSLLPGNLIIHQTMTYLGYTEGEIATVRLPFGTASYITLPCYIEKLYEGYYMGGTDTIPLADIWYEWGNQTIKTTVPTHTIIKQT